MSDIFHSIDPYDAARDAGSELLKLAGVSSFDSAVVLGSGWSSTADIICKGTDFKEFSMSIIPGLRPPTAKGHEGTIRSPQVKGKNILILMGRSHLYEGHEPRHIVHAVRAACTTGIKVLILTNAAGSLRDKLTVGEPVLVSDHINLTAQSPLTGPHFVNMVDAYSPKLRAIAHEVDPELKEGIYAVVAGPQYETPAEVNWLRTIGADLVGMSTVFETIVAREAGIPVLGLSLVTDYAADKTGAIDHNAVLSIGTDASQRIGKLLRQLIEGL